MILQGGVREILRSAIVEQLIIVKKNVALGVTEKQGRILIQDSEDVDATVILPDELNLVGFVWASGDRIPTNDGVDATEELTEAAVVILALYGPYPHGVKQHGEAIGDGTSRAP